MKRLLVLLAACSHAHDRTPPPLHTALWDAVEIATPPGMSDLTLDDKGHWWAVAERDRIVVEMQPDGTGLVRHPLDGVPAGLDTEALAYLGDGRFAIGIEGAQTPIAGVLYAVLEGDHLVVKGTRLLGNAELGVAVAINHGVEGICGHGEDVIAAIETVGRASDGSRWAPLVWLHGTTPTVAKLRLTSEVGKISALACRWQPDGTVDLRAIERHYSVSRILRATLAPGQTEITPQIDLDMAPVLHDSLNLEGLVVLPDGRYVAINDNQGQDVSGPTELLVFHPR